MDQSKDTLWLVMGGGRSGRGAVRLLAAVGRRSRWVDERAQVDGGDEQRSGSWAEEWLDGVEGLILSPGVPIDHGLVGAARERGLPVIGEIELAARFAQSPIVAVTGSNGKTTTTRWITRILQAFGLRAVESGNIGYAFTEVIAAEREGQPVADVHVVENSSFQLESIDRYRPEVAVLLNITPDHLDRHGNMDGYAAAKERVAKNMTAGQTLIVNADDARCLAIAGRASCDVAMFGLAPGVSEGGALDGDQLVYREGVSKTLWCSMDELGAPGRHNALNALAAAVAAKRLGADDEAIRRAMREFESVEHRIEFVAELDGARYYNDSKSTNSDSLVVALESFSEPIVLIAGGRDKSAPGQESPFRALRPLVEERVAAVVLIGEAADLLEEQWQGAAPVTRVGDMDEAVREAHRLSAPGHVVLLSPGCASFDLYANFEERGRDFKRVVVEVSRGGDQ